MVAFTSKQLRAFMLVAQHRSFSRAAEALFITPSGLSVLIRELETQLGFRLFDRTTRRVALTRFGGELIAIARRNVEEFDNAVGRIARQATDASRSLSIGATPWVAANILPPAIRQFRDQQPAVRVDLVERDRAEIMQGVRTGKLDLGLGVFIEAASGVRRTSLFPFSLMILRPQGDPVFRPATMAWSAVSGDALIALPPANPVQQIVRAHLARARVRFRRTVVFNYLETVLAMVEAGEGVAVVPSFVLPACRHRQVTMTRLTNPTVQLDFYQIASRARPLSREAEEFSSFIRGFGSSWAGLAGVQ